MVNETLANTEATTTEELVAGEAPAPVAPTVEQLQADIKAWESKYGKEVGDRDRGMARQAETLKQLNERLAIAEKAADDLARQAFGEEEEAPAEVTPYQRWKAAHTPPKQPTETTPTAVDPAVAAYRTQIDALALKCMDASGNVKPELQDDWDAASGKWGRGDMKGAVTKLEQALTKTATPEKTVVKVPVDRTPSQMGGGNRARTSFTRAEINAMSDDEYKANRPAIDEALLAGKIK